MSRSDERSFAVALRPNGVRRAHPTHWTVSSVDSSVIDVSADFVTGLSGDEDVRDDIFSVFMDVLPDLQDQFDVTGRTPSNPERVIVAVARLPRAAVRDIASH